MRHSLAFLSDMRPCPDRGNYCTRLRTVLKRGLTLCCGNAAVVYATARQNKDHNEPTHRGSDPFSKHVLRKVIMRVRLLVVTLLLVSTSLVRNSPAATMPPLGPHDGTMHIVGDVQLESVISPAGLQVYLYDSVGTPLSTEKARGVATLSIDGNAKRYRYDLFPAEDGSLKASVNLTRVAGRQATVHFQLVGIDDQTVRLRQTAIVPSAASVERLTVSVGKPSPDDGAWIQKQKTCPVMDEPLGSMGQPVKLIVGDKPIFLCCKGCVKKVQAEPAKYLVAVHGDSNATVPKGTLQVRPGVFKVADADKSFIAAQQKCPVMDEPLDAMGGPYKVDADGKAIYICCPGCAKKIAADPQMYLAELKSQGVEAPTIK